jgi:hypothetical protein
MSIFFVFDDAVVNLYVVEAQHKICVLCKISLLLVIGQVRNGHLQFALHAILVKHKNCLCTETNKRTIFLQLK